MISKKLKKKFIRSTIFIISLLAISVSVAYGWFSERKAVQSKNIQCNIVSSNDMMISGDGINWAHDIEVETAGIQLIPLTTNLYDFYKATYSSSTNSEGVTSSVVSGFTEIELEELQTCAIVQEFKFQTMYRTNLYLSSESYISPARPQTPEDIVENGASSDYIAGAIRVLIQHKVEGEWAPLAYWVPNTTYQLTQNGSKFTFTTTGNHEANMYYLNLSGAVSTHPIEANTGATTQDGMKVIYGDIPEAYISNYRLDIFEVGVHELRVIIFVDGYDREVSPYFQNGQIICNVRFHTQLG